MPLPYIVAICITVVAKSAIKAGDTVTTVGVDQVDTGAIDTRVVHAFVDVLKHTMQSGFRRLCRPRETVLQTTGTKVSNSQT